MYTLKRKILNSIISSFALSFTLLFFGPMTLYFMNIKEFSFTGILIIPYLLTASIICILILTLIACVARNRVHTAIISIYLGIMVSLWIQGCFLIWNYGPLDGSFIDWNKYYIRFIIDIAVWVCIIFLFIYKMDIIFKHTKTIVFTVLAIQTVNLSITIFQTTTRDISKEYRIIEDNKYNFSTEENIIILVLDTAQSEIFEKIIIENEEYQNVFDGFTFYENAMGGYPSTYLSIPLILTGEYYKNMEPIQEFIETQFLSNSIPKVLKDNGYSSEIYPLQPRFVLPTDEIASNITKGGTIGNDEFKLLISATYFRYVPSPFKRYYSNFDFNIIKNKGFQYYANNNLNFINNMLATSEASNIKPVFKFYHIMGSHGPFELDKDLNIDNSIPQTYNGYLTQAEGIVNLTCKFLNKLKEIDVYDNSTIFIVGDHGMGVTMPELADRIILSGNPLFMFKNSGIRGNLKYSEAPVTLSDIPKTISSIAGIEGFFGGDNILEIDGGFKRVRPFYWYEWSHKWDWVYLPKLTGYEVTGDVKNQLRWEKTYKEYDSGTELDYNIESDKYNFGDKITFDLDSEYRKFFLGGFYEDAWIGEKASIDLSINKTESDLILKILGIPLFDEKTVDSQSIQINVNDHYAGEMKFSEQSEEMIRIPKELFSSSDRLVIDLIISNPVKAHLVDIKDDPRLLGFHIIEMDLEETDIKYVFGEKITFEPTSRYRRFFINGLYEDNWIGETATIDMPISKTESDLRLKINGNPMFDSSIVEEQLVQLKINDRFLGDMKFTEAMENEIIIPNEFFSATDRLIIELTVSNPIIPAQIGINDDQRSLGISIIDISIDELN